MHNPNNNEVLANIGGYNVETSATHPDDTELDIIKIVVYRGSVGNRSAMFYRREIDDLITVLEYWRDYYPGRGRNVRE